MKPAIATTTIHLQRSAGKPFEALICKMLSERHRTNYPGECHEFILLATQKRISFEEGNHFLKQVLTAPNHQHKRVVIRASMILTE